MAHIILNCVLEKNKLRVKFHSYVNAEGKRFTNVYNNNYNCRFPKDLRQNGMFYKILPNDLSLNSNSKIKPFYCIKGKNIERISVLDAIEIYSVDECMICMDNNPEITFVPCGHKISCLSCYNRFRKENNECFLCRNIISRALAAN